MTDRLDIDWVRAYLEGALTPAEIAIFERRVHAEPGIAELLRAYATVRSAGDDPVAPCTFRFEDLHLEEIPADASEARGARRWARWPGVLLPIAACLVLAVGAFAAWKSSSTPEAPRGPVALAAIPLDPVPVPDPLPTVPATLASYQPSGANGLRFLDGPDALEDARALARATGRPLLVFVYHPTCPLCVQLQKREFRDASVAPHADPFVLVQMDVEKGGGQLLQQAPNGWPVFLAFDPSGTALDGFVGAPEASELSRELDRIAKSVPAGTERPLAWTSAHEVARLLKEAESATGLAKRLDLWSRAATAAAGTPLASLPRAHLDATADEARLALESAKGKASSEGAAQAVKVLDAALVRFHGTPYELDFRRVKERLAATGTFPSLEASR